ncbi:MAG: DegT/DnrJ/EryC1/StrS family aminotransferase [Nanoarchaeota archaeon]|nr:DegT/DnrJ/EryC1/StrS family aminotransferase [Nanoarchaeota archaeon]
MQESIEEQLKKYTSKKHIQLTSSGNEAITELLTKLKPKKLLMPDQGGWIHYLKAAKTLNIEYELVKTNDALIDLDDLKNKATKNAAFIYHQLGAYIVQNPIKKIYGICNKSTTTVLLDVTATIATEECDGTYGDILICSFGKHKPINAKYGGCYLTNDKTLLTKKSSFNEQKRNQVEEALNVLPIRQWAYQELAKKVKTDLKQYSILHKKSKSINVIIKNDKEQIIDYCNKHNFKYRTTTKVIDTTKHIMSFIKVNEDAISIDLQEME